MPHIILWGHPYLYELSLFGEVESGSRDLVVVGRGAQSEQDRIRGFERNERGQYFAESESLRFGYFVFEQEMFSNSLKKLFLTANQPKPK